jgi:hypothetical protein
MLLDGGSASVLDNDTDADFPGDTLNAVLDTGPLFAALGRSGDRTEFV